MTEPALGECQIMHYKELQELCSEERIILLHLRGQRRSHFEMGSSKRAQCSRRYRTTSNKNYFTLVTYVLSGLCFVQKLKSSFIVL